MPASENERAQLESLLSAVKEIGQFGLTTALSRVIDVIQRELDGHGARDPKEKIPLEASFDEMVSRRNADRSQAFMSGSVDKEIAMRLIDLYDGRLSSVEIADVEPQVLASAREIARSYIERNRPYISIDLSRFKDSAEVVAVLRRLTDNFVQRRDFYDQRLKNGVDNDHHDSPHFTFNRCAVGHTIGGPISWQDNGTVLVEQICEWTECEGIAASKHSSGTWLIGRTGGNGNQMTCWDRIIWEDGTLSDPPPSNPPNYVEQPWDNRCPFLTNAAGVMQSSDWGWRTLGGVTEFHGGIDIAVGAGTPIISVSSGVVVAIEGNAPDGKTYVIVKEGDHLVTYRHIVPDGSLYIGKQVSAVDPIGTVSPHTPKIHFHFARHKPPNLDPDLIADGGDDTDQYSFNPCP